MAAPAAQFPACLQSGTFCPRRFADTRFTALPSRLTHPRHSRWPVHCATGSHTVRLPGRRVPAAMRARQPETETAGRAVQLRRLQRQRQHPLRLPNACKAASSPRKLPMGLPMQPSLRCGLACSHQAAGPGSWHCGPLKSRTCRAWNACRQGQVLTAARKVDFDFPMAPCLFSQAVNRAVTTKYCGVDRRRQHEGRLCRNPRCCAALLAAIVAVIALICCISGHSCFSYDLPARFQTFCVHLCIHHALCSSAGRSECSFVPPVHRQCDRAICLCGMHTLP